MVLTESEGNLDLGDEAPDFSLVGTDGETYSLGSFAEYDALLVVFTCNHCPYAQAKFDELNHLAEAYDDLAVVGINPNDAEEYPDDSFEKMREYVDDGRVQYTAYLRDESQEVAETYGATCTPDPFLFANDDGTFRLRYHGRIDDAMSPDEEADEYVMREAVEAVLADEAVDVEVVPSRGCSIKWRD
ncbi:thioredoxin family protein [Salinigranum halophilum]|jgi:peroxiredoxin|uniref:thioredoxin family protein n=1 Tax=Salinigranum halophilum TaxID=2565931 RepID=UPI00115D6AEF|nr:thioredoxin family protein [Salinigranum halophilum]